MDKAKNRLAELKEWIDDKLDGGFSASELADIAGAINDIEIIERYLSGYDDDNYKMTGHPPTDELAWLMKNIKSELTATDKYYKKWQETKDMSFKTIAREELRHAELLIKLVATKATMPDKKDELQKLTTQYQELLKSLS